MRSLARVSAACAKWFGHLVTIEDEPEGQCVAALVSNGVEIWIGYVQDPADAEPATGWEWVSGSSSSYAGWRGGQPNNELVTNPTEGQDCAYLDGGTGPDWYDHECQVAFRYVCER